MRSGLAISIVISLVLIGGAFWHRIGNTNTPKGLTLTDSPSELNTYATTSLSIASDDSVNKTENLGKQLLGDLLTLGVSGQATSDNIQNISAQYVNNLSQLANTNSTTINKSALNVVGNSKAEVSVYSDALSKILLQYEKDMKATSPSNKVLDAKFFSAVRNMGEIYSRTADSLKLLPVPSSLADLHLKLINLYLSDASAMAIIASTDTDPAKAFSGLINIQSNLEEEQTVLNQLNSQLSKL